MLKSIYIGKEKTSIELITWCINNIVFLNKLQESSRCKRKEQLQLDSLPCTFTRTLLFVVKFFGSWKISINKSNRNQVLELLAYSGLMLWEFLFHFNFISLRFVTKKTKTTTKVSLQNWMKCSFQLHKIFP